MAMGSAIVAPSVGSLLMEYSAFLAWFTGEVCMFMAILTVLLLPRALGKQIPASSLSSEHGGDEQLAANGSKPATSIKAKLAEALEKLKPVFRVIVANRQLLLLFAMSLFSQIGNESLIVILLMIVSNRYGWTFAQVSQLYIAT